MESSIIIDNKLYNFKDELNICNGYGLDPKLHNNYKDYSYKCPHNWINDTIKGWLDDPSNPVVIKDKQIKLPHGSYYNYI